MWPFRPDIKKMMIEIARNDSEDKRQKIIDKFIKTRYQSIPALVKTLKEHTFDATEWVDFLQVATQLLLNLGQVKKTRKIVVKSLRAAQSDRKGSYSVNLDYLLRQIGAPSFIPKKKR